MRIVVAIKQILDPAGVTVNRRRERIFTDKAELIINPADRRALEAALRLKDTLGAEVIALSLGPASADDALREALAMGADSAYLLTGNVLVGADAAGVSRALARAVERIGGCDLLLTGQMAADSNGGEMAGRLAELLGAPQVLEARQIEPDGAGLRVTREWDGALIDVATPLPAVIAVSAAGPTPRYPHGARILNAYRQWEVVCWTAEDLELGEEETAPIVESMGLYFPPPRELGTIVSGEPAQAAREVVAQLRQRRLI